MKLSDNVGGFENNVTAENMVKSGLCLPDCLGGLGKTRVCYFPHVRLVITYLKKKWLVKQVMQIFFQLNCPFILHDEYKTFHS